MSITLIVEVIVLLPLLHTGSSTPECAEDCCKEGKTVTFECQVPALRGTLIWKGVGFDCPNPTHPNNKNTISLPATSCPLQIANEDGIGTGSCGPYFGNLNCTSKQNLTSMLTFKANYEMNGGSISCEFSANNTNKTFPVRVGVAPNPPSNVRVEIRKDGSSHFEWTPPNESVGGIGGYNITYGENCGNCSPAAGFLNQTEKLTAECSECIGKNAANNSTICSLNVSTVSEDCWFDSCPVEAARCSVGGIMADISPTLMIRQCLKVSINQRCNESADSFQALLQFADGACQNNGSIKTTEKYTLQNDYETCIRVGTDPICFSAVVSRNGVEVARTGSEELILLQCNTSNISSVYNNGVTVTNSITMGVVPQGTKVLHNTVLSFQCTNLCKLMGTNTTRCVNGTFESLLNESSHCDCGPRTAVIAVGAFVGLVAVIIIIIIIVIICIVKIRDYLRAYFPNQII